MKQIMTMLSTALNREEERWMPCFYATTPATQDDAVNALDRRRVVKWFVTLTREFGFYPEALFASVAILDRFLNSVKVKTKYLKCVAVTCFYLGVKATEEDERVPSTRDLVQKTGCGCSISEVHRMERCILDKFDWDLRLSTPLDFLHAFHGLAMRSFPDLLRGFPPLSPSQHLHQLTLVLARCLLHHQLAVFSPSVLAVALLSLDLEDFSPCWGVAILELQRLGKIDDEEVFLCKKAILRCLNREAASPFADWTGSKGAGEEEEEAPMDEDDDDDAIYDDIRRLYGDEMAGMTLQATTSASCGAEAARSAWWKLLLKPTRLAS